MPPAGRLCRHSRNATQLKPSTRGHCDLPLFRQPRATQMPRPQWAPRHCCRAVPGEPGRLRGSQQPRSCGETFRFLDSSPPTPCTTHQAATERTGLPPLPFTSRYSSDSFAPLTSSTCPSASDGNSPRACSARFSTNISLERRPRNITQSKSAGCSRLPLRTSVRYCRYPPRPPYAFSIDATDNQSGAAFLPL